MISPRWLLPCLLVALVASGCRHRRARQPQQIARWNAQQPLPPPPPMPPPSVPPNFAPAPPPAPLAAAPVTREASGAPRMTASYGRAAPQHRALEQWAVQSQLLEPIAEMVSRLVVLRRPLSLVAQECPELAFWSARAGAVVFCYRYFDFVLSRVPKEDFKPVILFTMLHEVAHALSAELSLPIVGREEDAADRFAATVMLANITEPEILLPAARFFRKLSTERTPSMWDEHLTDGQRFSDLVCLAWGAGPSKAGAYGAMLPLERRERCDAEYEQARVGWHRLLRPYSRVRGGQTFWPE